MCKKSPCWGTPDEIRRIMDAGFSDKLTLHVSAPSQSGPYTFMVQPKTIGSRLTNQNWPDGQCEFLDANDRCALHDMGMKPLQGRVALHGKDARGLRGYIADLWRAEEAQQVVNQWKSRAELAQHG